MITQLHQFWCERSWSYFNIALRKTNSEDANVIDGDAKLQRAGKYQAPAE
jgi:hypothetical protein